MENRHEKIIDDSDENREDIDGEGNVYSSRLRGKSRRRRLLTVLRTRSRILLNGDEIKHSLWSIALGPEISFLPFGPVALPFSLYPATENRAGERVCRKIRDE